MILSDSHRFIFVAVRKTGSSSTETALAAYQSPITDSFNRHATCLKLQRDLPADTWNNYFKFAFVRDPYDRMVSWYYYRKRDQLRDPTYPRHHLYTGNMSFTEFIEGFAERELMFKQVDFIAPHGGGLLVDRVGRFESLQADFTAICQHLGLPVVTLPKVRSSQRPPGARETLWTPATRRIVNDYFAEDFAFFDYPLRES